LHLAQELLDQAKDKIQGVYLVPSYRRYDVLSELAQTLKENQHIK